MNSARSTLGILLLGLFTLTAHAGLYKWTDADGKVHFSDHEPVNAKAQVMAKPVAPKTGGQVAPVTNPGNYRPPQDNSRNASACLSARDDVAYWRREQPVTYNQQTGAREPLKNVDEYARDQLESAQRRVREYCK
ncbi:uncharacterized protein DUF4124 [Fluviicoccus keumensis]|uniref:Uncharacterized protein DUF4124 n=1 Tax=Fluviicoccus keumensis TaxID=1435465 RepID=A0A4Q7YM84_9GAMM|nr:DUF4124 domain-containing protein [Fluviicoccus keumensis]RZU38428.1 uncharacterized protein DUF4124 [Fluviicoccus keumensis]